MREIHARVCKIADIVSDLCTLCGKHVGASPVFDGEGRQLGGVFGFLSIEGNRGVSTIGQRREAR